MRNDVIVMVVNPSAATADERLSLLIDPLKDVMAIIRLTLETLNTLLLNFLVVLHALVVALPNVTHLSNWSKI